MTTRPTIVSLAVTYPSDIRTNEYFRKNFPDVVAHAEEKTLARMWSAQNGNGPPADDFDVEMAPYLNDPFRGAVRRRVLGAGENALSLESTVARSALAAAGASPG